MRKAYRDLMRAKLATDVFAATSDWMKADSISFAVGEMFWLLDTFDPDGLEESRNRGAGRRSVTAIAMATAQKLDEIYPKVSPKNMKTFVKSLVPLEAKMAKLYVALQDQEDLGEALASVRSLLMRCIEQATPASERAAAIAREASNEAVEAAKSAGKRTSQLGTDSAADAATLARQMGLAHIEQAMTAGKTALAVGEDVGLRLKDLADLVAATVSSAVMASGAPIGARASLAERAALAVAESHEGLAKHFVQIASEAARGYVEAETAKEINAQKAAVASKKRTSTRRQSKRHSSATGIAKKTSLVVGSHTHVNGESFQEGSDQEDEPASLKVALSSSASAATTDLSANGDGLPMYADIVSSCSDLAAGAATPSQRLAASAASLGQGELISESADVDGEVSLDGISFAKIQNQQMHPVSFESSDPPVDGHLLHSQRPNILAQYSVTHFEKNLVGSASSDTRAQGTQSDLAFSALPQDILGARDMQLSPALAQSLVKTPATDLHDDHKGLGGMQEAPQLPQVPLPSHTSTSFSGSRAGTGAGAGVARDGVRPRQSMLQGKLPGVNQKQFNWIQKLQPKGSSPASHKAAGHHRTLEDVVAWRGQHGYRHRQVPEGMEIMWSVYDKAVHPNSDQVPAGMEHLHAVSDKAVRSKSGGPCVCAVCMKKMRLRSPYRTPRLPTLQT